MTSTPSVCDATDDVQQYDALGFILPPRGKQCGDAARVSLQDFENLELKAERQYQAFAPRRRRLPQFGHWSNTEKHQLKLLYRNGVPHKKRAEVWWQVLGCEARRQQLPDAYEKYSAEALDPKVVGEIQRDLARTLPTHRMFKTEAGREKLRSVLHAFACHYPRVRYCQGVNFIAALLLIVFDKAERAFWALACALEMLDIEGYYVEGMMLLRADMCALDSLLPRKIALHFQQQNTDLMHICSGWFITWFATTLPVLTVMRVWDALFFEGYKVLFRVALGIFKLSEPKILRCHNFEEVMKEAKRCPQDQVDYDELLRISFVTTLQPLRRRNILRFRDEAYTRIETEERDRFRRRAARQLSPHDS